MYSWFGLLLFSSVFPCNNMQTKDLWHSRYSEFYNSTILLDRFKMLLRFVRYDRAHEKTMQHLRNIFRQSQQITE